VVVTASRNEGRRAAHLGADEVLLKPVDLEELLEQVARHARAAQSSAPHRLPLLNGVQVALLVVAGLLGVAAATPVLAQTRTLPFARLAQERVETTGVLTKTPAVAVYLAPR
jgi:DNA-binding response OmpR family regulator